MRHLLLAVSLTFLTPLAGHAYDAPCKDSGPQTPIPAITLQPVADGFSSPTHVATAGDGSERLFVVEQRGMIWIIENGKRLPDPFLDIRDRVQDSRGELGLFSIAFHPRYRDNGLFYVDYTSPIGTLHSRISRFHRRERHRADPASETILLKIDQPYSNHNGGQLAFGPDGYLYIGMGDGGAANDPHGNGQNRNSLLGKLLRIDVDHEASPLRYAIPKDNPFVGTKNARGEIWSIGMRNPWRFAFDRANGALFVADVGQNEVEEIDVIRKGGNYGWNIMEGEICTPDVNPRCDKSGLDMPIHVYHHPQGFSITGGFVYRGQQMPALCGVYLYADFVTKRLWGLRYDGAKVTLNKPLIGPPNKGDAPLPAISSFGEDEHGELYVADHERGRVLRITTTARKTGTLWSR